MLTRTKRKRTENDHCALPSFVVSDHVPDNLCDILICQPRNIPSLKLIKHWKKFGQSQQEESREALKYLICEDVQILVFQYLDHTHELDEIVNVTRPITLPKSWLIQWCQWHLAYLDQEDLTLGKFLTLVSAHFSPNLKHVPRDLFDGDSLYLYWREKNSESMTVKFFFVHKRSGGNGLRYGHQGPEIRYDGTHFQILLKGIEYKKFENFQNVVRFVLN